MAEQTERFDGTWNGQEVHPKRVWSGHRFTDEECDKLLAGEEIEIEAVSVKTGKGFRCAGRLANLEYNGQGYVGFERTRFINGSDNQDGPDGWCKYTFTDSERADLAAGKTVKVMKKFIGKSGRAFSAEVRWNKDSGQVEIVEFLK